jgi:preprotein translocase subunit YajC
MYFLMIRPQQRRNRELQQMQTTLGPGAEVMTGSGIYGTVTDVDDSEGTIDLEVSPGVSITFARAAVARVISAPPETEEDEDDEAAEDEADHETDHETDQATNPISERKD